MSRCHAPLPFNEIGMPCRGHGEEEAGGAEDSMWAAERLRWIDFRVIVALFLDLE